MGTKKQLGSAELCSREPHAKDLIRLQKISEWIDREVNLAGIGIILELQAENMALRKKLVARTQQHGVE